MLRLLFLTLITALISYASPLKLANSDYYSVQGHLSYYEDINGTQTLSQIQNTSFHSYNKSNANFGFSRSVYWFRIDLEQDPNSVVKNWWLLVSYPLLEYVDVYLTDSDGKLLSQHVLGSMVPFADREMLMRDFVTKISFEKCQQATLYLRVKTQSSIQVPLSIYTFSGLLKEIEKNNFYAGLYYGIFLIIFLYNVVLFFFTRDPNYMRYALFLSTFILWQLSFDGIGIEYLWTDWFWFIKHGAGFWIAMSSFSALYFSRSFLNTLQFTPKMDRLILFIMRIALIMAVASLILPYGKVIAINAALGSIVPLILFITGIMVLRKNYRPARFYVAGWSSLLVGTIIFAFNKFDIIPSFDGVNHIQQIGSAVEMIFLSWALADRIHLLQKEYIDKLNHLNESLSENVRNALMEAREKDRLFVQQSRLAAMGEMIEQIAHQWRQPLNTLALINQEHYVKYKLGTCDEKYFDQTHEKIDEHLQYLSKTIDDFRNFYKTDKSKSLEDIGKLADDALRLSDVFLKYAKIKTDLNVMTSRKVLIAKNEMVQVLMNLIKNAHDAIVEQRIMDGKIIIKVEDSGTGVKISVEDNARGIAPDVMEKIFDIYFTTKDPDHGTGLGLHMSKYIIEESFGGKIVVENIPDGVRFMIFLIGEDAQALPIKLE